MKETVHANGSLEDSISEENGTSDSNGDPKEPLDAMEGSAEAAAAAVEVLAAKYEPGDLIWGRLGHYPFWPCIVMRDPVDRIFHKKGGEFSNTFYSSSFLTYLPFVNPRTITMFHNFFTISRTRSYDLSCFILW